MDKPQNLQLLKQIVAGQLVAQGWTSAAERDLEITRCVATKDYETAVGPKTAIIYLNKVEGEGRYRLSGEYQSEGRNVLSTTWGDLRETGLASGVEDFCKAVDKVIEGTYARRLAK